MDRYITLTVFEFERALGEAAPECEDLAANEEVAVYADGQVWAGNVMLSDATGPGAWSYLTDSREDYAGFAALVGRTGAPARNG